MRHTLCGCIRVIVTSYIDVALQAPFYSATSKWGCAKSQLKTQKYSLLLPKTKTHFSYPPPPASELTENTPHVL